MKRDLKLAIEIDPSFSFLASNKGVLAGWLRSAADSLDPASEPAPASPETRTTP